MLKNAFWIKSPKNVENPHEFRKNFNIKKAVVSAQITVTSLGMYALFLNNKRIGKYIFAPGYTDYNKRIQYQTYDITKELSEENLLIIKCAYGWASPSFAFGKNGDYFAKNISVIFSLKITYTDGETEEILSDDNTQVYTNEVLNSEIYDGETIDYTKESTFLGNAIKEKRDKSVLIFQEGEEIIEHERIAPIKYIFTPKNEFVIDFGQNLTGYVEIELHGKKNDKITIYHCEVLDKDGNFYAENLRTAKERMTYILNGEKQVLKPYFSFQGFRYIKIEDFPIENIDDVVFTAIAVYSDIKRTGHFLCGNENINQLYHNIIWGQKSNFLDIPTDCPQRNERLGWTGDAQVFCKTATLNFNVEKFFFKWLRDMKEDQGEGGEVYGVIPKFSDTDTCLVSAGWGDAAVICPWTIYMAYGNREVLSKQFDMMKKWVEYMHTSGDKEFLWLGGEHFGDWLGLDNAEGNYKGATGEDFIASCFFFYSTSILIKAGKELGMDMKKYEIMAEKIKDDINTEFIKDDLPIYDTQTACALLLHFKITNNYEKLANHLNYLIEKNKKRLTTGFLGTPYLLHALSDNGYLKEAYNLLLSEEYPSWLYSVKKGATTMWEHWDSIKPDGTFWSANMNSFNHYAYGSVFDWIYKNACGIYANDDGAGFSSIIVEPKIDERLGFVNSSYETKYGTLISNWYINNDGIHFEISIPKNTQALLKLPGRRVEKVTGGDYIFVCKKFAG